MMVAQALRETVGNMFEEWARQAGVTMSVSRLHVIPIDELEKSEAVRKWALSAVWYEVTVMGNGRQFSMPYGMGRGLGDTPPSYDDVFTSLADIGLAVVNTDSLEDWAEEWGIDPSADDTEDRYTASKERTAQLLAVCGSQSEFELLIHGERA
jgi:hypothetical protein